MEQPQGDWRLAVEHGLSEFGQGRLEADQSEHSWTSPMAAKRFTAPAATAAQLSTRRKAARSRSSAHQSQEAPGLRLPTRSGASRIQVMNFPSYRGYPPVRPNPSLKGSTNGGPPGPVWWYAVHFHQPGPGVPPLAPP